jgi:hypothetical protein
MLVLVVSVLAMLAAMAAGLGMHHRMKVARRTPVRPSIDLRGEVPAGPRRVLVEDAGL